MDKMGLPEPKGFMQELRNNLFKGFIGGGVHAVIHHQHFGSSLLTSGITSTLYTGAEKVGTEMRRPLVEALRSAERSSVEHLLETNVSSMAVGVGVGGLVAGVGAATSTSISSVLNESKGDSKRSNRGYVPRRDNERHSRTVKPSRPKTNSVPAGRGSSSSSSSSNQPARSSRPPAIETAIDQAVALMAQEQSFVPRESVRRAVESHPAFRGSESQVKQNLIRLGRAPGIQDSRSDKRVLSDGLQVALQEVMTGLGHWRPAVAGVQGSGNQPLLFSHNNPRNQIFPGGFSEKQNVRRNGQATTRAKENDAGGTYQKNLPKQSETSHLPVSQKPTKKTIWEQRQELNEELAKINPRYKMQLQESQENAVVGGFMVQTALDTWEASKALGRTVKDLYLTSGGDGWNPAATLAGVPEATAGVVPAPTQAAAKARTEHRMKAVETALSHPTATFSHIAQGMRNSLEESGAQAAQGNYFESGRGLNCLAAVPSTISLSTRFVKAGMSLTKAGAKGAIHFAEARNFRSPIVFEYEANKLYSGLPIDAVKVQKPWTNKGVSSTSSSLSSAAAGTSKSYKQNPVKSHMQFLEKQVGASVNGEYIDLHAGAGGKHAYENFASAREAAKVRANLGDDAIPFLQELGRYKDRIYTGMQSPDGTRGWRLDYDTRSLDKDVSLNRMHINWWFQPDVTKPKLWYEGMIPIDKATEGFHREMLTHFPKR